MKVDIDALIPLLSEYAVDILAAFLIFAAGRWISRLVAKVIDKILRKKEVEETVVSFLKNLVYYALLAGVVLAALSRLGVNTTSFLTVLGAAGLAVGMALKDSLSNFAAGVMLILFRPFRIGDVVSAAGITAKVERITIFHTAFSTFDNQLIIVPNGKIISDTITNINARETRRIDLTVGIGYGDDLKKAKKTLESLARGDDRILDDPGPGVSVAELADSSVNLALRSWVRTEDYGSVRSDLLEKIKTSLDEAGISIPFPQQDVHLFSGSKETERAIPVNPGK